MGFLKKLSNLFAAASQSDSRTIYPIVVKCKRCGEIIQGQVNLASDVSAAEAEGGGYYCRKLLMGKQRCFQQIEVELQFNKDRQMVDRQIVGGQFVDE